MIRIGSSELARENARAKGYREQARSYTINPFLPKSKIELA